MTSAQGRRGRMAPLLTSPKLRGGRMGQSPLDEAKMHQCTLGELCWVATGPRPDTGARLARIASPINSVCGSGVYRISELVRALTGRKYASPSRPWKTLGGGGKAKDGPRNHGEQLRRGSTSLVGGSGAAYGGQWPEAKNRLTYVIGLMLSTLYGPCHLSHWPPEVARKPLKSTLGGEVYALGEKVNHAS